MPLIPARLRADTGKLTRASGTWWNRKWPTVRFLLQGAKALALSLVADTSIIKLDLGDNWLLGEGAAAIAEMLKENCYISGLYYPSCSSLVHLFLLCCRGGNCAGFVNLAKSHYIGDCFCEMHKGIEVLFEQWVFKTVVLSHLSLSVSVDLYLSLFLWSYDFVTGSYDLTAWSQLSPALPAKSYQEKSRDLVFSPCFSRVNILPFHKLSSHSQLNTWPGRRVLCQLCTSGSFCVHVWNMNEGYFLGTGCELKNEVLFFLLKYCVRPVFIILTFWAWHYFCH